MQNKEVRHVTVRLSVNWKGSEVVSTVAQQLNCQSRLYGTRSYYATVSPLYGTRSYYATVSPDSVRLRR